MYDSWLLSVQQSGHEHDEKAPAASHESTLTRSKKYSSNLQHADYQESESLSPIAPKTHFPPLISGIQTSSNNMEVKLPRLKRHNSVGEAPPQKGSSLYSRYIGVPKRGRSFSYDEQNYERYQRNIYLTVKRIGFMPIHKCYTQVSPRSAIHSVEPTRPYISPPSSAGSTRSNSSCSIDYSGAQSAFEAVADSEKILRKQPVPHHPR